MGKTELPSYFYFAFAGTVVATFAGTIRTVLFYSSEKVTVAFSAIWISVVAEGALVAFFTFVSRVAGASSLNFVAL